MTIYAVASSNEYDYWVAGIFDTKELAQLFIERFQLQDMVIDEWTLNPHEQEIKAGLALYNVYIYQDGTVQGPPRITTMVEPEEIDEWGDLRLHTQVYAKDEEQAIELANQRRLKLLAENRFVACGKKGIPPP